MRLPSSAGFGCACVRKVHRLIVGAFDETFNASVRRPHREAWEDVEGTELDDVCDRLRRVECTETSAAHAALPLNEEPATGSLGGPPTAQEGARQACMPSARDERMQPSSAGEPSCLAAAPEHDAAQAGSHEVQQPPEAACSFPSREERDAAVRAAAAAVGAAASWENASSSSSRRGGVRGEADTSFASSLRHAPSTFSASLPTAPYERLLFQRQQQRRLLQQQATLRSFPSLSSTSGSVETLAAALQDKRHRQQQQQQEAAAAPSPSEACVSPTRGVVAAELRGPSLPPALRLQLLQEALWTGPSAASSSLGRSERKWWSMDDRNLEAFMFSHHRTFIRRLGRGVPPTYRWRAWQAVCSYHRELRLQEGEKGQASSFVETNDHVKVKQHLESLPEGVDAAAFLEAFEGGNVCPKLYSVLSKHKSAFFNLILIDVPRTFPELPAVDRDAQGMLFRILNAFANLHVEVGYCQGMNFIAGLLLLVSSFDEFEAFSFFCFVMVHQHLKEFFRERFPLLRKYIRAFDDLAVVHLPKLREHFIEEGVMAPVYLHQWFLTLFITSLPLRSALVVWDFFLAKGLHAVLQLAIALLRVLARFLIRLKFEEIVKFLKSLKCSGGVDDFRIGKMLVKQAAKVQIPSHIMVKISPNNLEAIIREAELEEEEESRSRNAAFIAAAAAVENTSAAASNPLALIEDDEDEVSLHKVVTGGPANGGTAKSSACSTPRERAEEMVLIRSSSPAHPPAGGCLSCGVSTARPWFSCSPEDRRSLSSRGESPRDERGASTSGFQSASLASACAVAARLRRAESISEASEANAGGGRQEEGRSSSGETKHFFTDGDKRWPGRGEEEQEATSKPQLPLHADTLAGHSTPPHEEASDEDGYELVEISNAERAGNPALVRSGRDAAAGSRASSSFAEDHERDGVGEREGSFMDAIARLWLAGR
ncbi:hypothetical protein Esti_004309 [Eimeria stiedai]